MTFWYRLIKKSDGKKLFIKECTKVWNVGFNSYLECLPVISGKNSCLHLPNEMYRCLNSKNLLGAQHSHTTKARINYSQ